MPWKPYIAPALTLGIVFGGILVSWGKSKKAEEVMAKTLAEIEKKLALKMDKETCEKDMKRGEKQFEDIKLKIESMGIVMTDHGKLLAGIEGKLENLPDALSSRILEKLRQNGNLKP